MESLILIKIKGGNYNAKKEKEKEEINNAFGKIAGEVVHSSPAFYLILC